MRSLWLILVIASAACRIPDENYFTPGGGDDAGPGDDAIDIDAPSDAALSSIAQRAYLKASNTQTNDLFGVSVALSADGSTLAVGGYGEDSAVGNPLDNSQVDSGAVYVFHRVNTTWTQQGFLKATNVGAGDLFGISVAISDDGSTVAVGAYSEDSIGTGVGTGFGGLSGDNTALTAGAVYVYTRGGTIWTQQAYIKASNTAANDKFGQVVALSGDGATLAVGADGEDSNATGIGGNQADNSAADAGAVYVFTRAGVTWTQQAYVKASNTGANHRFGEGVSLNADGSMLAVGAFFESGGSTGVDGSQANQSIPVSGAAYTFTRTGTAWTQQAYFKASNTGSGDLFGYRVALSADGSTLAVGAYGEESNATGIDGDQLSNTASSAGAVYVFAHAGSTWSQQAYVKASNTDIMDLYGRSGVSLSADGSTLMVGAIYEDSAVTGIGGNDADNTSMDTGAVYLYTRVGATWTQRSYIKASNTEANDRFGDGVALSADGSTLAVGATLENSAAVGIGGNQADNAASDSGAVYVFR